MGIVFKMSPSTNYKIDSFFMLFVFGFFLFAAMEVFVFSTLISYDIPYTIDTIGDTAFYNFDINALYYHDLTVKFGFIIVVLLLLVSAYYGHVYSSLKKSDYLKKHKVINHTNKEIDLISKNQKSINKFEKAQDDLLRDAIRTAVKNPCRENDLLRRVADESGFLR